MKSLSRVFAQQYYNAIFPQSTGFVVSTKNTPVYIAVDTKMATSTPVIEIVGQKTRIKQDQGPDVWTKDGKLQTGDERTQHYTS